MFTPRLSSLCLLALLICLLTGGCSAKFSLFGDKKEPLKEYALKGKGEHKLLVVPLSGFISGNPKSGLTGSRPGLLQEVAAQLELAQKDKKIKAVLLMVNSPGGTAADSQTLYFELEEYKRKSGVKLVAMINQVGASGGYYACLAADEILAHPSSVVGSVGTIFISPKLAGLMDKIGVAAEVEKSGKYKDMGSPFRASKPEEREKIQKLISGMNAAFVATVSEKRQIEGEKLKIVAEAGIFGAQEAKELGLIDATALPSQAVERAIQLAGLEAQAKVVAYRHEKFPNDNIYNALSADLGPQAPKLLDLGLGDLTQSGQAWQTGFYHLWAPELNGF